MTREVARIKVKQLDNYLSHTCQDYGERDHEAMVMTIQALEQEPVLDKIREEISEYGSIMVSYAITKDTKTDKGIEKLVSDVLKQAKEQVLEVIDKYKAESEELDEY